MLDLNHLPKTGNGNIDYFYNTGSTSATFSWQTWEKPKGIGTIVITCIGGGGGGRSGVVQSNGAGGAGGGSGGFTRVIIPAMVLPDVLYVSVGKGGNGGASGVPAGTLVNLGISGTASYVSIAPSTDAIYVACFANGGGAALSTLSSSVAAAAAIATRANCLMSGLGQFFALAGQEGAPGNSSAGQPITYPTTGLLLSGGASGGGSNSGSHVGGSISMPIQSSFSLIPTRNGGTGTGLVAGPGDDGITLLQPLMSTGGAGGGKGPNRGGNGGLGSGGGGGGSVISPDFSGAGGNGGDGLVIIQTF
jgi:hypothetical protein